MQLEPLDKDEIESIVSKAIQDAVDFIQEEIEPQRTKAQRYYDLECDLGYEEGRSSVVSSKCREVVRGIKPSLQRVFLQNDKPVEFIPRGQEDVAAAEQATQFINYKFSQLDGYKLISDVFQDALVKKTGIAYCYYNEEMKQETHTMRGLSDDEFALVTQPDEVEIIEHEQTMKIDMDQDGVEIEMPTHDVTVVKNYEDGEICIESIPPEDFFVDRNARSIEDFYVCGHSTEMRISDLLAMGFDLDDLADIDKTEYSVTDDEAEFERRGYAVDDTEDENPSVSSTKVTVTQAFMELDIQGTGVPQLYQFLCVGAMYKLLQFYEADTAPYAIFEIDPEPHAFFGTSLVDLTITDQDASTSMLRGILDNAALTNNPAVQILDGQVAVEDLLNNEIGRVVRVKSPNAITEMAVPFTAAQTLPALQYFDQLVDNKTGVSKMAQGLDPEVLKSATATSVAASMEGQAGQAEVIARNLAEGGMKRLFKMMLDLYVKNTDKEEIMRMNGSFIPVDPRAWSTDMDLMVNVGLGTGRENERLASLQMATLTQIRNTLADILAIGGIRNPDRHFMPMSPEIEQQMMMQAQQQQMMMAQQQQQADPAQAIMQAEAMKAQTKAQIDMAKMSMDNQYKMHELAMKDDLERDKMVQDLAVEVAKVLGQYGTAVDVEGIKQEQNAVRQHNEEMMGGMNGSGSY